MSKFIKECIKYGVPPWGASLSGGGGGNVATDVIFDFKGDLPVGTGANTAARLGVGTDGQVLIADSTQLTGLKWGATPAGTPAISVVTETSFGQSSSVGVSTNYARQDHTHGSPTDPIPAHLAASDPHPQYATDVDLSNHISAPDPHSQYALDTDLSAHVAAANPHTVYQLNSAKDASGGYVGLTLYKINFNNTANTFTSFLTNSNTGIRTYTFPDKDITVADNADLANKVIGPASAVNGNVVVFNGTTGKIISDSGLTLSGSNTGDQTITLTGDVTGSGTGSFAANVASKAITLAKMNDLATKNYIGRTSAGTGVPEAVPVATLKTDLALVKADVGLSNVDNTADAAKSVANAVKWNGSAITISSAAPSGGADGDVWFQYV